MAYANSMTLLLNKIERRIGTKLINLPPDIAKESWAEIIKEDTLTTFSRFYPHKIEYTVIADRDKNDKRPGYFHIDENIIPGDILIYGLRDINFSSLLGKSINTVAAGGMFEPFNGYSYGMDDIAMIQMSSDMASLSSHSIYPVYEHPHMIALKGINNLDMAKGMTTFVVELFTKHADSLTTISPTKMETFEQLAELDIKIFLYSNLKYFDNLESVFGTVNLRLDEFQNAADDRRNLIEKLNDSYVSADNTNQPVFITV